MQGYTGMIIPIPLGLGGMASDFSDVSEQPQTLLLARNVRVGQGVIERAPGSAARLSSPLPAGIVEFLEFFPNDYTQRVISILANGKVYKTAPWYQSSEVTSFDGLEPILNPAATATIVDGGAETGTNVRKCFVFSGNNQVQVITGDGTTRRNISNPAVEWTAGNYPTAAFIANGSMCAFGCPNSPHTLFISNPNDHEDFTTLGATQVVSVYPGDGDKIVDGFIYKGRPWVTKFPRGLYYLDTTNSAWIPVKAGDSFGASCPKTSIQVVDDFFIANAVGSITSLRATLALGGAEQGDILRDLHNASFSRQYLSGAANAKKRAVYYENRRQLIIGSSTSSATVMNRASVLDFTNQTPMFYFYDKDQMNSLGLIRDTLGVPRPFYGGTDGQFYDLDSPNRNVGNAAYLSEFQTHNLDFKWAWVGMNINMEEKDKQFDYIGVTYEPTGNWPVMVDAYVDGNKRSSKSYGLDRGTYLDGRFPLDKSSLVGKNTVTRILPINCTGKKLRLRVYSNGLNQNFRITALTAFVRMGGTNNRSG